MLKPGTILYNSKSHKIEIQSSDSKYINTIVERISYVSFNNGTQKEKQIFRTKESYPVEHIGIYLFFKKSDIDKNYKFLVTQPEYSFNKLKIINYYENKHKELISSIINEAPDRPIVTEELNTIIDSYFDENHQKEEEKKFYRSATNKITYFGRMDFSTVYYKSHYEHLFKGTYYDKIYISREGSHDIGNTKVVDWRSPIGAFYYDTEKTSFTHGDTYEYKLLLKRSFQFNPLRFHDLYIDGINLYAEGSVDKFLQKLLYQKRSLHKPTDIIQSIQSNQNKIIRSSPKENLILQGCAGSGKTMILLHRLSYLIYNKHILNPANVSIITPSETFKLFYSDLAEYLDLDEVSSSTINNFYSNMISQYSKDYFIKNKTKPSASIKNEIMSIINETISSDTLLNLPLSYDDASVRYIHKSYDSIIKGLIPNSTINSLNNLATRFDIDISNYNSLSNHDKLQSINALSKTTIPFKNQLKEKLCLKINNHSDSLSERLNLLQVQLEACDSFCEKIQSIRYQSGILEFSNKITHYKETITLEKNILDKISAIEVRLKKINDDYTYDIEKIKNRINYQENELSKLKSLYNNPPRFNIFKRNNIRHQADEKQLELNKLKSELTNTANIYNKTINELYTSVRMVLDNSSHVLPEESITWIHQLKENLKNSIQLNIERLTIILDENELLKTLLNQELYNDHITSLANFITEFVYSFPKTNNKLISSTLQSINDTSKSIIDQVLSVYDYFNMIDQLFSDLNVLKEILNTEYSQIDHSLLENEEIIINETPKLLTEAEKAFLEHTYKICEASHHLVNYIKNTLIKSLGFSKEIEHGVLNTRFRLFMNLLLLYLHFGSLKYSKEAIFIDEGQNYSINDYRILQRIFGNQVVFNIYGDINQLLNLEVGTANWDRLKKEFKASYYELNENYRNTIQITKYCNKTFNYSHTPIGIDGEKVTLIKAVEIDITIEKALKTHSLERIAYISKHFKSQNISHRNIFTGNISDATGLEFDVVIFDPIDCSKNERYIGMTRAIEQLFIVN